MAKREYQNVHCKEITAECDTNVAYPKALIMCNRTVIAIVPREDIVKNRSWVEIVEEEKPKLLKSDVLNVLKRLEQIVPRQSLIEYFNECGIDYVHMSDLQMYKRYVELSGEEIVHVP